MTYRQRAEIVSIKAPVEPKKPILLKASDALVNSKYEFTVTLGGVVFISGGIAAMTIAINWLMNTLGFGLGVITLASFAFVAAIIFDVLKIKIQTYNRAMELYNYDREQFLLAEEDYGFDDSLVAQSRTTSRKPPPTPIPSMGRISR